VVNQNNRAISNEVEGPEKPVAKRFSLS